MTLNDLDLESDDSDGSGPAHRRGRRALKATLIVVAIIVGVSLIAAGGLIVWLNSSLGNITRFEVDVAESVRIADSGDDALNIVLLGTDTGSSRGSASIMEAVEADTWRAGVYRSDATMLLHIPASRDAAYIISIPRDSYVPIYDAQGEPVGENKINAALSLHGPTGAMLTVEQFAGVRIDHIALVDWDGFEDITDALGGVAVSIAGEGRVELDGAGALDYVRQRYNLPGGDFDRVKRQQNFLRAMSRKMLSRGVVTNPGRLKSTLDAVTSHLAVDSNWSNGEIRSLAWSLRGIDDEDIHFLTIPHLGTDNVSGAGSIVVVDDDGVDALFAALRAGTIETWLARNPDVGLGDRVN